MVESSEVILALFQWLIGLASLIDRGWFVTLLAICLLLMLASGIAFGAGLRYPDPLEFIVPTCQQLRLMSPHQV